ncbi:MAG: GNAT family N-acetyltransferase [Alphaproteobacteria bacterium]|nr:GNAT family N-acetyltransferase [Alphaproteobacteria bacterium]
MLRRSLLTAAKAPEKQGPLFTVDPLRISDFCALAEMIPSLDYPWFYGKRASLASFHYLAAAEVFNHSKFGTLFHAIRVAESDELIGAVVLLPDRTQKGSAEIGYFLKPTYHRRGVASTAAEAVVREAVEKGWLKNLFATVHPENLASRAILKGLGLRCVAGIREGPYKERDGVTPAPRLYYEGTAATILRALSLRASQPKPAVSLVRQDAPQHRL